MLADQITRIKPEKGAVGGADILEAALGVRADDEILHVLHHQTISLLLNPQGVLDRTLRRDVLGGSGETQGCSVIGAIGPALLPKDTLRPVATQNTVLDGKMTVGPPPGSLPLGTEPGLVVRMHDDVEGVQARGDGVGLVPEQTIGLLGPTDLTPPTIKVPTAELCGGLRLAQRCLADGQPLQGLVDARQILLDADIMGDLAG